MQSPRTEYTHGVDRVCDVLRIMLSFSKSPRMPKSEQGVSARMDGMTGLLPMYDRCLSTGMDAAWPVPVGAERVTSGNFYEVCYTSFNALIFTILHAYRPFIIGKDVFRNMRITR